MAWSPRRRQPPFWVGSKPGDYANLKSPPPARRHHGRGGRGPDRVRHAPEGAAGEAIALTGRVLNGAGELVTDAVVELWQPDAAGRFPPHADPNLSNLGRCACDEGGTYRFETVRPGAVPGGGVPHAAMMLYARGVNRALHLRCYFEGDPENGDDPILAATGNRASTLMAREDAGAWRLDIRLQGEGETVFLDV